MQKAFSLFELLIVMAIVGILAAISFPLYTRHIAKVQCQQAHIALLDIAHKIEQHAYLTGSFPTDEFQFYLSDSVKKLPYQFNLQQRDNHHYILTAIAIRPNNVPPSCQTMTLDEMLL